MDKIYVVMGATGEYSDHREWAICYYENEELAKKHVKKAEERYREIVNKYTKFYNSGKIGEIDDSWKIPGNAKNTYDENMQIDYTGTNYYIIEVKKGNLK